jgi:hypothetical protein
MKAMRWIGPSILLAAAAATQAIRIAGTARTDSGAAIRDAGIGVGVLLIFGAIVVAIFWARSGDRVKRRRALGGLWIDDVTVSPFERLREPQSGSAAPRDFALGMTDDALQLWATANAEPVLSIAGSSIRSVEVVEIPTPNNVEYSVELTTDDGPLSIGPSGVLGFAPPRRDAIAIANRVSELMPIEVRPALFE